MEFISSISRNQVTASNLGSYSHGRYTTGGNSVHSTIMLIGTFHVFLSRSSSSNACSALTFHNMCALIVLRCCMLVSRFRGRTDCVGEAWIIVVTDPMPNSPTLYSGIHKEAVA